MNTHKYLGYILTLCLTLLSACSKKSQDTPVALRLSQEKFEHISASGAHISLEIEAQESWEAYTTGDWYDISEVRGQAGKSKLEIEVSGNFGESRQGTISIKNKSGLSRTIILKQGTLAPGQEVHYRLPVIIHILYKDASDKKQNPPAKLFADALEEVNELYREKLNINVEFVLAKKSPDGTKLKEAGIHRIRWESNKLNPFDVVHGNDKQKYRDLLWDFNKYINIFVYSFNGEKHNDENATPVDQILGLAQMPFMPETDPLEGLSTIKGLNHISLKQMPYPHSVSINANHLEYESPLKKYTRFAVGEAVKHLDQRQNKLSSTLAHELGHYLGLFHVFSEGDHGCTDTDYCSDTESYDKTIYLQSFVKPLERFLNTNNELYFYKLFERSNCQGKTFVSRNIMDYSYTYLNEFTPEQRKRMRHVLYYGLTTPGVKKRKVHTTGRAIQADELRPQIVVCRGL